MWSEMTVRRWWAHQDLNLGPIDYEDGGDDFYPCCKSKNRKQFSPLLNFSHTGTEPIPNLLGRWGSGQLCKLKKRKEFFGTELRTFPEPRSMWRVC